MSKGTKSVIVTLLVFGGCALIWIYADWQVMTGVLGIIIGNNLDKMKV